MNSYSELKYSEIKQEVPQPVLFGTIFSLVKTAPKISGVVTSYKNSIVS